MMNQHPTVVISGGSSGLGKAIGLEAAKQGATVVFFGAAAGEITSSTGRGQHAFRPTSLCFPC
ncbi:Ketoacyl reductase [Lacticaseibacillus paracasei subsp. paracasei Lpp219]|nr:Ketoacyl reductase [Lacticaseibacillus paracasei subsp. paracasei Lpp219]